MLSEKKIGELKARLLVPGFPGGTERGLRGGICLGEDRFTLHYRGLRQGDVLNVSLHFQKAAGGSESEGGELLSKKGRVKDQSLKD